MTSEPAQRFTGVDMSVKTAVPHSTRYFPLDVVKLAVGGCCHDFAIAVHRRTGMALGAIWRMPLPEPDVQFPPLPVHVFCYDADGFALDAEGLHDVQDLVPLYHDTTRPVAPEVARYETEADLVEALHKDCFLTLRENGIAGAEEAISGSPEFLGLLAKVAPERHPIP